jgi:uncharacterized protein YdaU (DUF1376 family)
MAQFPALPLWTDAYLGDTTHLRTIEHGAYFLLLLAMWRSGDRRLLNDDKMLARFAHLTMQQWLRIKPIIMAFFDEADGYITQGRLSDEWVLVKQKSLSQTHKARARWLKTKNTPNAAAYAAGIPPTPTPTPSSKEDLSQGVESGCDWPSDFREQFWSAYPRKVGKKAAIRKLEVVRKTDKVPWSRFIEAASKVTAREIRFIPHPATWLNQGRWDDEPNVNGHAIDTTQLTARERTINALHKLGSEALREETDFLLPKLKHQ